MKCPVGLRWDVILQLNHGYMKYLIRFNIYKGENTFVEVLVMYNAALSVRRVEVS